MCTLLYNSKVNSELRVSVNITTMGNHMLYGTQVLPATWHR